MANFTLNFNKQASVTRNTLNQNESSLQQAVKRLTTGKKFNAPSDGPASFSLLSNLNTNLQVGNQGVTNAQNGTSLLDTADAGLANIEKIFSDIAVLAEDAANGVWTDDQRKVFDNQAQSLLTVANNIALSTDFNGTKVLSTGMSGTPVAGKNPGTLTLQIGSTNAAQDQITVTIKPARTEDIFKDMGQADATDTSKSAVNLTSQNGALNSLKNVQEGLTRIRDERASLGATQKAIEYNISNRQSMNEQAKNTISNIGDADVATEMENYTNFTAKVQASNYMYVVSMQNPAKIAQMIQSI